MLGILLLLSGCAQETEQNISSSVSSSLNETDYGHGSMFLMNLPQIGLSFPYWENLNVFGDVNSGEYDPARKGEYSYTLSRSNNYINYDGEVSGINYDRPSDGLADWSVPRSVEETLKDHIDTTSCALFASADVYVPVDMRRPHLCKATITLNGSLPVIIAVGFGHTHESTDYPESIAILFSEEKAIILAGIMDFPETDASIQALTAEHMKVYPDTEFPNEQWEIVAEKVSVLLEQKFREPSQEMKNNLDLLLSVARGMRLEGGVSR